MNKIRLCKAQDVFEAKEVDGVGWSLATYRS